MLPVSLLSDLSGNNWKCFSVHRTLLQIHCLEICAHTLKKKKNCVCVLRREFCNGQVTWGYNVETHAVFLNVNVYNQMTLLKRWFVQEGKSFCNTPKGRLGMSNVSPWSGIAGLSFDSTLLSPVLFFCLVLLLFLLVFSSAIWPILLNFFQKIPQYFWLRERLFCVAPV